MRTETLFWIIIGLFGLSAMLGLIFTTYDKEKTGKKIIELSAYMIIIIFLLINNKTFTKNYSINSQQSLWKKHRLPQLDQLMYLEYFNERNLRYSNWSNDSIIHLRKSIEYDTFDIYSITDVFINKKKSKTLTYFFIKPNFIRSLSLTVTINNDTITKMAGDSILKEWGIYNKAYHE